MSDETLSALRGQIDNLNFKILELYNERARVALQIAQRKKELGYPGYDPVREGEMIERLLAANKGPFDDLSIGRLFKELFKNTLELMESHQSQALLSSRRVHPQDTIFNLNGAPLGGANFTILAGPCSLETPQQIEEVAAFLAQRGLKIMRGGAFKPRTSPYSFQGLGLEGLKLFHQIAKRYHLAVLSEIDDPRTVEEAYPYLDMFQIGARNMYNYSLLREVGRQDKPILLKRHFAATLEEFLLSAEYLLQAGARQIVLCERGIRTFERWTRNTLDLSAVPLLQRQSHLPVVVDISHAVGRRDLLLPLARAARAVGAQGLMLELHPQPQFARSDSQQQLDLQAGAQLLENLKEYGPLS